MSAGFTTALLLTLGLSYAGMAALCLSMARHYAQLKDRDPTALAAWTLRVAGYLLLMLAVWPAVHAWGTSVGIVAWLGFISAAALLWVSLWAWSPRRAVISAAVTAVLIMGCALSGWLPFTQLGRVS